MLCLRHLHIISNIPPQNHGINRYRDFGPKINKLRCRETLSEYVSELIPSSNLFHLKIPAQNLFMNEMVINLQMFCAGVEDRIKGNGQGRYIITPKFGSSGKENAQIFEHLSMPAQLSSCRSQGMVLRFSRRSGHCVLLLSVPGDGVVPKIGNEASGRSSIKSITCPIGVRKGRKRDRTRLKKDTKIKSAIDVSKDMFCSSKVNICRKRHELTNLVHSKTQAWSGESQIMK